MESHHDDKLNSVIIDNTSHNQKEVSFIECAAFIASGSMQAAETAFLEMAPADEVLKLLSKEPGWPNVEAQDLFVNSVIHSNTKFPPSKRWLKALLRLIESEVSQHSEDGMSDALAEVIIEQSTTNPIEFDNDDPACITYTAAVSGVRSTLHVLRAHNQVGTRVWEAGLFLAEIISTMPELITDKIVVELGAGCGVTSILAVKSCCSSSRSHLLPKRVFLTDHMPEVLSNLKHNIVLNTDDYLRFIDEDTQDAYGLFGEDSQSRTMHQCCPTAVRHLDFSEASVEDCLSYDADVLLVADCNYSEDISTPLVRVLELFLVGDSSTRTVQVGSMDFKLPFCLLAATVRNETTYQHFLDTLGRSKLSYKDVTDWAVDNAGPQRFRYQNRGSIRILLISR
jgi:protein-lysine N-methyltransferase EEF2KMT